MSIYFSAKLNSRRSLQLSLDSLPDAPVTAVRPEEKTNAPVDTEAPAEDVDDVIELPDVPVKAPKRPEAPEKTKGFDLMLLLHFHSLPCFIGIYCVIFFYSALMMCFELTVLEEPLPA
jgi:hypothetical protein